MTIPQLDDDSAWQVWRDQWELREDTIYLNHGSFGPPSRLVREAQRNWQDEMNRQPMDFFLRRLEAALFTARHHLAGFVGTSADNLVFVENATAAMNVLADSFPFIAGDEVLLTDHEYDAVKRIWRRRCQRARAAAPVIARLPLPIESREQVVDAIFAAVTERTRLIVVSHVTSPTAIILPVASICAEARRRGIATCVDGPHAPAQVPLAIDELGCDFYTASCHKWLSAPFGSGFFYAAPKHHDMIQPQLLSWGRLPPAEPKTWDDEFVWTETRDSSAYLTIPTAIEFLQSVGWEAFRARTHWLAKYARDRICARLPGGVITPDSDEWYGSMALVQLPVQDGAVLQAELWNRYGVEVPITKHGDRHFIRVSCHLYNTTSHVDRLVAALADLLQR